MIASPFPVPDDEPNRLKLLADYRIAGTAPEPEYDRFADLAANLFNVPVAGISFVEADRVWLKARRGIDISELGRGQAFCAHAIMSDRVFVVPDTTADPRFAGNPIVVGPPNVRFYAASPLVQSGHAVGTLWILDVAPRSLLSDHEERVLADLAAMVMDRLEQRRLETAEREATERFLKIAATSPDAVVCGDEQGSIIFWNRAAERIFGYDTEAIIGHPQETLFPETLRPDFRRWQERMRQRAAESRLEGSVEVDCRRADGSLFPAEISYSSWRETNGFVICGMVRDVTARHHAEDRLRDLARTDSLTGLPNRAAFLAQLEISIRRARHRRPDAKGCALLLVDLDRFKEVNDALGHGAGDRVLQKLANRLKALAGETVHPFRLSGDEFTVILDSRNAAAEALGLADRIREELKRPLRVQGQHIDFSASVGTAASPEDGATVNDLLANADLALYRAKAEGGNRSVAYVASLREAAVSRRRVESELRRAERNHEFILYYQPQVSIADGSVVGAEALLRWRHPEQGVLAPASFIAVLETSPIASAVGAWVIESAIAQAAEWVKAAGSPLRVGVNLFASQFVDGELASAVTASLHRHGLKPECLELEITENIALRHDAGVATPLRRLVDSGVGVAFDDFGTGYGSLTYLKRVPVTRLKIDRSFIHGILSDTGDAAIVRAVLALGRSLGVAVVAEGVESEAQRLYLDTLGCVEGQGYLFGRPMPANEFTALLNDNARRVA